MISKTYTLSKLKIIKKIVYVEKKIFAEKYFSEYLMARGIYFKKLNGSPKGIPDYLCWTDKKKFYVEVKTNGDGLNVNQLNWLLENQDKEVYIFILDQRVKKPIKRKFNKKLCSSCYTWRDDTVKQNNVNVCQNCLKLNKGVI